MSDISDLNKLKVTELRAELQARGLDSKGNKPVLVERLREVLEAEARDGTDEVEKLSEKAEEDAENEEDEVGEAEEPQQKVEEAPEEEEVGPKEEEAAPEEEKKAPKEQEKAIVKEEEADAVAGEPKKNDYEDAPMEEIDAEDKMEQEDESEDKSAVDLIKDDFFNGHTEELQGLDEEDENKDEVLTPSATPSEATEVKQEPVTEKGLREEVKKEAEEERGATVVEGEAVKLEEEEGGAEGDGAGEETWDHKRGKKRAGSPITMDDDGSAKKSRSDAADVYIIKNVNEFDKSLVVLDYGNADLSLRIEKDSRLEGTPMTDKCFGYMWHGVRSTYGFTSGRICFEVRLEKNLTVQLEESETHPHVLRVGWSVEECGLTLGEEEKSWGYGGTGKASTNLKFKDYGCQFSEGDVVGAYLDFDVEPAVMSFTVNGDHQGIAYEISKSELANGQALFPHILTKNVKFSVNFGSLEPFMPTNPIEGYTFAGKVPVEDRVAATPVPDNRGDCEVIMMVGLPACGKTTWIEKFVSENKSKKYTVLGTNDLIDKMKVNGIRRKRNYAGRWDQLIMACTKGLNHLLHLACNRRRNYIIDQTNVYPSAQKRKMRGFTGFKRRAVVICPSDEDLKLRTQKREKEEGKDVPDSAVLEMKANVKLPSAGEHFDSVEFVELNAEEAQKLVEQYNKEGQAATLPKSFGNTRGGGQGMNNRRDYGGGDRGGRDHRGNGNSGGGFRGGWDRDRDRRGGYDRRDRGGSWNRPAGRDFSSRLGPGSGPNSGGGGGGYNRDSRGSGGGYNRDSRGSGGYNNRGGGGFRDNRGAGGRGYLSGGTGGYNKYPETSNYSSGNTGWNQQGSYGQSYGQGYGVQSSGYGSQGYGAATGSVAAATTTTPAYGQPAQTGAYNWNQQYYNQQQPAQQYYGQSQTGYRSDSTATAGSSWGASSTSGTAASAWGTQPQSAWGAQSTTAAAPAAAAVPSAQQQIWGTSGYQPASSTTQWGAQPQSSSSSYSGYSYGYKK